MNGKELTNIPEATYSAERAIACCKRELTKNEIACAMSHINVWRFFLSSSYKNILILEDDAILNDDFSELLDNLDSFPEGWDMINFCSSQGQYNLIDQKVNNYAFKKYTKK